MSRIGKRPIELPTGVAVALSPGRVQVNGPLGELSQQRLERDDDRVRLGQLEPARDADRLHGPHAAADERATEVGGAGRVVGDRAEEGCARHGGDASGSLDSRM